VNFCLPPLESLVKKTIEDRNIPGMAVAVVHNGKIIYEKGFGVRACGHKQLVDRETVFQIGSVSKPVSATLTAILCRENLLDINEPVDGIPGATLRHILGHAIF
jgi:CubicO group peptidase (beta-lactamase class C family)